MKHRIPDDVRHLVISLYFGGAVLAIAVIYIALA